MVREMTNAGMLGQLVRFNAALAANATELAHLEGALARFGKLVTDAQAIAQQQAALAASKQEASKQMQTLLNEGLRLATGLGKLLQEFYGLRAEKLAEFGLQPFRGRPRKQKPEAPATPPPVSQSEAPEEPQA
jgi:methionyl-tRNA synthetase